MQLKSKKIALGILIGIVLLLIVIYYFSSNQENDNFNENNVVQEENSENIIEDTLRNVIIYNISEAMSS